MDLTLLIATRKVLRGKVTNEFNNRATFSQLSAHEQLSRREKLKGFESELNILNDKILPLKWTVGMEEEALAEELDRCQSYKDKLIDSLVTLSAPVVPIVAIEPPVVDHVRSLLKSPVAPLPRFTSADGENLGAFLLHFETTLSRFSYTEYDKLLLLKQQVSGRALILIDSLEPDSQTYTAAKTLLTSALASESLLKHNVIKMMAQMKLEYDSEPFEYISKIRKIQQSVTQLEIGVEDVMQYYFLNGLNDSFRGHLIQICNNTRPTLTEIVENFFHANERYQMALKTSKNRAPRVDSGQRPEVSKITTSLASKINFDEKVKPSPFASCTVCGTGSQTSNHPINKCPIYKTASDKIAKLKLLKGCIKCAGLGHQTSVCDFRFSKRCIYCSAYHFSFLCDSRGGAGGDDRDAKSETSKTPLGKSGTKPKFKGETLNGLVCPSTVYQGTGGIDSVLSTFGCSAVSGRIFRGLRDCGSQINFISERCLVGEQFEVLDSNVQLKVTGINESKTYDTKLVKIKLRFGNSELYVRAMTLPEIRVNLKLPGLGKIVTTFVEKGYPLADPFLTRISEEIGSIDLILGASAAYCFSDYTVHFGLENMSVYSRTPFGILLLGDVDQMIQDLPELPPHNETTALYSNAPVVGEGMALRGPLGYKVASCMHVALSINCDSSRSSFSGLDGDGNLDVSVLSRALDEVLDQRSSVLLNEDSAKVDSESGEVNEKLIEFLLSDTKRNSEGRLVMPLLWNGRVSHLLGSNRNLAHLVLQSNLKKLKKNENFLKLMDDNVKDLEQQGFVERIENIDNYLEEHPNFSFLAHMGVFKPDRETTKCRMVFLSNLCERTAKNPNAISHNQAIWPGPCLNQKLSTSFTLLRFDRKLLCFDLKKAFLQIALNETDQSKLLFLWFKNVTKHDFTIQAYKNCRLPFGLRCSPTMLMIALFKLLMLDTGHDSDKLKQLKTLIYSLVYMDNGAVSTNSTAELRWAYESLGSIFNPYCFELQQIATNDETLQTVIGADCNSGCSEVKLFGLMWNVDKDTISTRRLNLDGQATSKRLILKSIAENFDPFNLNGPILNRARIFMHGLQLNKSLGWDTTLAPELLREWRNIAKQVNSSGVHSVPRCVGRRDGRYRLLAFTDSSKVIYGASLYIQDLDTGEVNFLVGKNRLVGKQLEGKTIPALEFLAIGLGAEMLVQMKEELSGTQSVIPINIGESILYSDSLVSLSWINAYVNKFDKMSKRSVFVMNRLENLVKLCQNSPVKFTFVDGYTNPADCLTRPMSSKKLSKSNYFTGPAFLTDENEILSRADILTVTVPNPLTLQGINHEECGQVLLARTTSQSGEAHFGQLERIVAPDRFSSFAKLVNVHKLVLKFIDNIKVRLRNKNPQSFGHFATVGDHHVAAYSLVIRQEQEVSFPEIFEYFKMKNPKPKDMPDLVAQLNVFVDKQSLLRVKCKIPKFKGEKFFPLLLSKQSVLTKLIILEMHKKLSHGGVYTLLTQIRKKFWIPHCFSVVKQTLKQCTHCRRFNQRAIKLNQNSYRDFRLSPPSIPFGNVFIDHLGPYHARSSGCKSKIWILCITCLWTRAVNLKVCTDLSTREFLRGFQLHTFEYGIPQLVLSDLGSQLVAGANIISDFLSDCETRAYFAENNVKPTTFEQCYKGCKQLSSLVETCVKMTKRLLSGSVGNQVLDLRDFDFFVAQAVHLVNRRPVAFKEGLRDTSGAEVPEPITPEMLIHGRELISVNVIPDLQVCTEEDLDWRGDPVRQVKDTYLKLKKIRLKLDSIYTSEFLVQLIAQATDSGGRYKPVTHRKLCKGDIVLLKEPNTKPVNYPLGVVREVQVNDLDEVTGAVIFKGKTRETVKRHASSLVPLLQAGELGELGGIDRVGEESPELAGRTRRAAAEESERRTRDIFNSSF